MWSSSLKMTDKFIDLWKSRFSCPTPFVHEKPQNKKSSRQFTVIKWYVRTTSSGHENCECQTNKSYVSIRSMDWVSVLIQILMHSCLWSEMRQAGDVTIKEHAWFNQEGSETCEEMTSVLNMRWWSMDD